MIHEGCVQEPKNKFEFASHENSKHVRTKVQNEINCRQTETNYHQGIKYYGTNWHPMQSHFSRNLLPSKTI